MRCEIDHDLIMKVMKICGLFVAQLKQQFNF